MRKDLSAEGVTILGVNFKDKPEAALGFLDELGNPYAAIGADDSGRMGLDWGGLDVLRDRVDGRLYVVDVNKTDVGPVIALSWTDKMRSMRLLGQAMDQLVTVRSRASPTAPDLAGHTPRCEPVHAS